jgi:hypothetical protein
MELVKEIEKASSSAVWMGVLTAPWKVIESEMR